MSGSQEKGDHRLNTSRQARVMARASRVPRSPWAIMAGIQLKLCSSTAKARLGVGLFHSARGVSASRLRPASVSLPDSRGRGASSGRGRKSRGLTAKPSAVGPPSVRP